MRHRKSGHKLSMDSSERKAMYRNMVTSLLLHGQIKTTEIRAKDLRKYVERVLSIGKRAPSAADLAALQGDELQKATARRVAAFRRLGAWVQSDEAIAKVMGEYAERFRSRPGGYTRVVKVGRPRGGDNASMAVIQLVEAMGAGDAETKPAKKTRKKATKAEAPPAQTASE
jgi:large subunit ribosomal protein L17